MRDYADIISQIRIAAIGVKKQSNRLTLMQAAADAIEELLAELTTIRKQLPRWIIVEERLPEINDDVLVCNMDYGKTELGFATDAVWDGDNFLSAWNRASAIHCVTHWMPLPEPPKGWSDA